MGALGWDLVWVNVLQKWQDRERRASLLKIVMEETDPYSGLQHCKSV